jgi:hypothetical protein
VFDETTQQGEEIKKGKVLTEELSPSVARWAHPHTARQTHANIDLGRHPNVDPADNHPSCRTDSLSEPASAKLCKLATTGVSVVVDVPVVETPLVEGSVVAIPGSYCSVSPCGQAVVAASPVATVEEPEVEPGATTRAQGCPRA